MKYWAFNDKYLSEDHHSLELSSRRKVGVNREDRVVFFHRGHKDFVFTSHANVSNVMLEEVGDPGYIFHATISEYEEFELERYLEDFVYSLKKIYRYNRPYMHFIRPYVRLPMNDYYALIDAKIYWARTAFGLFINQLPQDHLIQFIRGLAVSDPDTVLNRTGFAGAWNKLKEFISDEYITAAQVFSSIKSQIYQLNESLESKIEFSQIGFLSDAEDDVSDLIALQESSLTRFKELVITEEVNLLDDVSKRTEYDIQSFEWIFRGTIWPILTIEY